MAAAARRPAAANGPRVPGPAQFKTSTGTLWPAKNDGRVVVRTLLKGGITPVAGDVKIKRYIQEYTAKLEASSQRG